MKIRIMAGESRRNDVETHRNQHQKQAHTDCSEEKHWKIVTTHQNEDELGMEHGFGLHNQINLDPNTGDEKGTEQHRHKHKID